MRKLMPSSGGYFRARLSIFDAAWAFLSPLIALYVRDAYILSYAGAPTVALYCALSGVVAIIAFLVFRLHDGMTRYFSVHDALDVVKAVVSAELVTGVLLFTVTRLDGIPRSTPLIHALVLGAGLIAARTFTRIADTGSKQVDRRQPAATENIIMVGANPLSAAYIRLLEAYSPGQRRVIAILDDRPEMTGRAISGVRVSGPPQHLEVTIDEFAVHGVRTDRVIVGGELESLTDVTLSEIQSICERREVTLDSVPSLAGLSPLRAAPNGFSVEPAAKSEAFTVPAYFQFKRYVDFAGALVLIVLLLPLLLIVSLLVLLDVGSPLLFWQQRVGIRGSSFLLYKFRTLKLPFNQVGGPVPQAQRLSRMGQMLRVTCLDELPQLLNVLVGDMSLVGPRPLLPHDQPRNAAIRLMVRPGATGWAQVNGGTLLTAEEKGRLDEWYVANASLWLDLRIVLRTLLFTFRGERRAEEPLANMRPVRPKSRSVRNRTAAKSPTSAEGLRGRRE
jgi:lipopolysaccharide/colanic/teichoic acid biosynthesis glycosyltransferase